MRILKSFNLTVTNVSKAGKNAYYIEFMFNFEPTNRRHLIFIYAKSAEDALRRFKR